MEMYMRRFAEYCNTYLAKQPREAKLSGDVLGFEEWLDSQPFPMVGSGRVR